MADVLTATTCVNAMERMNAHSAVVDRNPRLCVMLEPSSDGATSEVFVDTPASFSCFTVSLYTRRLSRLDSRQRGGGGLMMTDCLGVEFGDVGGVSGMSMTGVLYVVSMFVEGMLESNM
jgi:hypothetical protein